MTNITIQGIPQSKELNNRNERRALKVEWKIIIGKNEKIWFVKIVKNVLWVLLIIIFLYSLTSKEYVYALIVSIICMMLYQLEKNSKKD